MYKRIDLFTIDSIQNCHDIIVNALMEAVMEGINTIVSYATPWSHSSKAYISSFHYNTIYKSYIWREFSLAFAQLYPIGGHYYWWSIDTEFLSLHLLFLPLEVLPKGCHHR